MKRYVYFFPIIYIFLLGAKGETPNDLQTKAAESKKNIAVYFSGSDWCSICHTFKKGFLSNAKVDSILKNNYVFYIADFPQRKKLEKSVSSFNESLAEKLNKEGHFPKLVITDEHLTIKAVIRQSEAFEAAYSKLENNIKK